MEHLNEETKNFLLSEPDEKTRIEFIQKDTWITYPVAKDILQQMDDMLNYPRNNRMRSLLVIGTTDNGKTSILHRFKELHPFRITERDEVTLPVVFLQLNHNVDERGFINSLMRAMSQPYRLNGKIDNSMSDLLLAMTDLQCKLLVIDEAQHITNVNFKKQRLFLGLIKYISTELKLPIVAFGTEEALNAFSSDPQLDNRFKTVAIPRWEANDDMLRLLVSFEKKIPLKKASALHDGELALQIFSKTNGTIGEISNVLKLSAIEAVKSGEEKITKKIVDKIKFDSAKDRSSKVIKNV